MLWAILDHFQPLYILLIFYLFDPLVISGPTFFSDLEDFLITDRQKNILVVYDMHIAYLSFLGLVHKKNVNKKLMSSRPTASFSSTGYSQPNLSNKVVEHFSNESGSVTQQQAADQ